jgi:hypothetical protein
MADFRELDARTYREQLINEGRFADHLLSIRPRRPGVAIAWGEPDHSTASFPIFTPNGIWFVLDAETLDEVRIRNEPTAEEYHEMLHALADRAVTISKCYFIAADEGPIKIGHSVNVQSRLKTLQSSCPLKLSVYAVAPGGEQRESAYHCQFGEYRLHGEWFERVPEIMAEIDRLNGSTTSA